MSIYLIPSLPDACFHQQKIWEGQGFNKGQVFAVKFDRSITVLNLENLFCQGHLPSVSEEVFLEFPYF